MAPWRMAVACMALACSLGVQAAEPKPPAKSAQTKAAVAKPPGKQSAAAKSGKSAKSVAAAVGVTPVALASLEKAKEKDPNALTIGVDGSYPPFSKLEKGKLTGFDIDIAQALCEQMKVKCHFVAMDNWAQVIPSLQAGRYDAVVASMSMTEERRRKIDFTEKYYASLAKLVTKKAAATASSGPVDLTGKRVAVQAKTTHEAYLKDRYSQRVQILGFPTLGEAEAALVDGRADYLLADALALQQDFLKSKQGQGFAFVGPDLGDPGWFGPGAGVGLPKQRDALKQQFNKAIADLRANGRYQTIAARYFPFDIYGGQP